MNTNARINDKLMEGKIDDDLLDQCLLFNKCANPSCNIFNKDEKKSTFPGKTNMSKLRNI